MTEILDFGVESPRLGSAQCPSCSRFARVISVVDGWTLDGWDHGFTVACKRCGVQSA